MLSLFRIKDKFFYGWVITIAGLIILTIGNGTRYSFGVFFKSIESEFGLTRGATSGVFSVYMLLCCVITVLGGWALDRYGPRILGLLMGALTGLSLLLNSQVNSLWQLFISYSLLLSLGTGAIYPMINSTVSRWFDKKRGLALGIASSGGPLGVVVMSPFATYLITSFDWRMAFIVMGLIAWVLMASLSMLLRKEPGDMGLLPDGASEAAEVRPQNKGNDIQLTGLSLLQGFRTRSFWFMGLVQLFFSLNVHLILTHTVPHAIDIGISPMDAAVILSLIGGISIFGRLVVGSVSDVLGRKPLAYTCIILQAGALISLIWAQDLWMFYLFAVVFGFSWGGLGILIMALVGDVFGMRNIGAIMGTLNVGWSLGAAVGPAMGGFMFDASGSYVTVFAIGAVTTLTAILFVALIRNETHTESS
ncbi:MFS transporter [Chloroflexota bacterium]